MSELFLVRKVFRQGNSLGMTIPEEVANILKIGEGDELAVTLAGGRMVVWKAMK